MACIVLAFAKYTDDCEERDNSHMDHIVNVMEEKKIYDVLMRKLLLEELQMKKNEIEFASNCRILVENTKMREAESSMRAAEAAMQEKPRIGQRRLRN